MSMMTFPWKVLFESVTALLAILVGSSGLRAQTPAFPGAYGFGAYASGGRGGSVYHVTTLADSGTGSFRDAVSKSGRIVVFDVGGYISLASAVSVNDNITIAGQTAPGGGIGLRGGELSFAGSTNIICRYLRVRPGSETASTGDDCISLYMATNVILDHMSMEFGPWNNIDAVTSDKITVQYSIDANPIYQQFGAHTENPNATFSWFYNLFASTHNRNPLAKINTVFVNNLLYNYQAGYTTHTSTSFKHDILNNYFVQGPGSGGTDNTWYQIDANQSIYAAGNKEDANLDGALNGSSTSVYWYSGTGTILSYPWSSWTTNVPVYSPEAACRLVISQSGALPRDPLDQLVLSQVQTLGRGTAGTGTNTAGPGSGLYTSQAQTGLPNNGYGGISAGFSQADTDGDGMPDYWEYATGSSPTAANALTNCADGYSLLEHYLTFLAGPHALTQSNAPVRVDLAQYGSGFSSGAIYSVGNASNGAVSLSGTVATFVPLNNYMGLGSFSFVINDGVSLTNRVNICMTIAAAPIISALGSQTVVEGAVVTLNPAVTGLPEPALQWYANRVSISGATNSALVLSNIALAQNGSSYSLVASNAAGCVTNSMVLTVQAASVFVALSTSSSVSGSVSSLAPPAANAYGAAGPAAGRYWNVIGMANVVPTNSTVGASSSVYSGVAMVDPNDYATPVTLDVSYYSQVSTAARTQPSGATGENTIQPGGVMQYAWRNYYNASGNYFLFTLSGLPAARIYGLYYYGGTSGSGLGGSLQLASGTVLPGGVASNATLNLTANSAGNYGSIWTVSGGRTNLMPQGSSWQVLVGQSDGAGNFSFLFNGKGSAAYLNGFQLVPVSSPVIAGLSDRTARQGDSLTLTSSVSGFPAPVLQWWTNGVAVGGGTNVSLGLTNLDLGMSGSQVSLVASNLAGMATNTLTLTVGEGVNLAPTNLNASASAGKVVLSWPSDHAGWILQVQTNPLSRGLQSDESNWFDVAGSSNLYATNFPVLPGPGSVFYRLIHR